MNPSSAPVREGDVIAGKYRVERVLGLGGMGIVVAAQHIQLQERVAIKFLLPEAASNSDLNLRFVREARAAAKIRSEYVARVLDVATLDSGAPYMVLEFLDGQDLSQALAARGPLPVEEAVGYLLQACEGVAEAHAVGIIHRDLKPSNLFLARGAGGRVTVKVLDFGISKLAGATSDGEVALTKTSATMGSPYYMSPEQMASAKHVDVRTDVWSLGVSLFELLTGRPPFEGESMTEIVTAVLQGRRPAMAALRQGIPAALEDVVGRSLETTRERRYADVAELAAALAPFGPRHASVNVDRIAQTLGKSNRPELARTIDASATPMATPAGTTTATPVSNDVSDTVKRPTRRAVSLLAGALLFLASAASIGFASRAPLVSSRKGDAAAPGDLGTRAVVDGSALVSDAAVAMGAAAVDAGDGATTPTVSTATVLPTPSASTKRQHGKGDPWDRRP